MKKLILLFLLLIISQEVLSQAIEKKIYVYFDTFSKETYSYEVGNGKIRKKKVYIKEFKKNGNIIFYIGKEMLSLDKKEIDTCRVEYLKNIKISDFNTLKKDVNKINSLYPYKVFPNLYLVEKVNDSVIVKYKVKWEYYIE
nr:hypothetical protein [Gaetbulibacter sp. 4G1]